MEKALPDMQASLNATVSGNSGGNNYDNGEVRLSQPIIGAQICRMVDEKNEILSEKMKDESKQKRMESMLKLLKDEPNNFTEYDDSLVRTFIDRISVMECTIMVRFKSGIEIEVAA